MGVKIDDMAGKLNLKVINTGSEEREVLRGYVSDLLSDVMGNSREGDVWITIQTHLNVIAVASLKDHSAVLFAGGNMPGDEVIARAAEEGVALLCSEESSFEIAGKIYELLK